NLELAGTDTGDALTPNRRADHRFGGPDTIRILDQFKEFGEAVRVRRYDPLPKPLDPNTLRGKVIKNIRQAVRNKNIQEWSNPNNRVVGWSHVDWDVRVFIGDRSIT